MTSDLAAKAEALRSLHAGPSPLVLPNVWDVAVAKIFEKSGFAALATTSGGVAETLGYPDGQVIPANEMLAAVARIAHSVNVPVTADLEAGYGLAPVDLVAALLETGAVGMNHEDTDHSTRTLRPVAEQAEKIAAIKDAGRSAGVDIVLNARIDVWLHKDDPEKQLANGIERAIAYRDAGADCLFPILCRDTAAIATLVRETGAPVNVFALPELPGVDALAELGVRRITFGSGLMRVAALKLERVAGALREGLLPWEKRSP